MSSRVKGKADSPSIGPVLTLDQPASGLLPLLIWLPTRGCLVLLSHPGMFLPVEGRPFSPDPPVQLNVLAVTMPFLLNQEKGKASQNPHRCCPPGADPASQACFCVCQGIFDFGLKSPGAKVDGDSCACLCVIQEAPLRGCEAATEPGSGHSESKAFSPRWTRGCGHKERTGQGGSHRWSQGLPGSVILAPGEIPAGASGWGSLAPG